MAAAILTQSRLKELLHYDPETGAFKWLKSSGRARQGRIAGSKNIDGYLRISIDGVRRPAHALVWLYMTGELPEHQIDHMNGDKVDNRYTNLRTANSNINNQNLRVAKSNSKSGILGVSWYHRTGKWKAQIKYDGKVRGLGYFETSELAQDAYLQAKRQHHPGSTI